MATRKTVPILLFSLFAAPALGQTAGMLSFQGLIKDAGGNPINGAATLEFNIFNAAVGGWLVSGPFGPTGVPATDGIVSTKFGPVDASAFNGGARWLEVKVNGVPLSRLEMATAPATAEQVNRPGTGAPAITANAAGNVGIGTTNPSARLDVVGTTELNGNVDINSDLDVDAGTLHVNGANNRVGIGTTNPLSTLDVAGEIRGTILRDQNNPGYYVDPASTATSLFAAGELRATAFRDQNNPTFYLDPASGATSLMAAGEVRGKYFGDLDNTAYYVDPASTLSLNAAGTLRAVAYFDQDNLAYYVDPGNVNTSLNAAGTVTAVMFRDQNNTAYYLDPASSITSLNAAGEIRAGDIRSPRFLDSNNTSFYLDPASSGTSLRIAGTIWMQPSKRIVADTALTIAGANLVLSLGDSGADQVVVPGNDLFMAGATDIDQNIWFSDGASTIANYIRWDDVTNLACGVNIGNINSAFIWNIGDGTNSGWSFNNGTDSEFMVDEVGAMNIDSSLTQGGGCDVAEAFLGTDDLPPGTLVVLDPSQPEGVIASSFAYESGIVGVVSTMPGILMRGPTADAYPLHEEMRGLRAMLVRSDEERAILEELEAMQVEEPEDGAVAASSARRAGLLDRIAGFEAGRADLVARKNELEETIDNWTRGNIDVALVGRVPVRVVGAVRAGDHLTASDMPGVAMAQLESGPTIGIALEDYGGGGEGKIITLIQPGWYGGGPAVPVRATAGGADLRLLQTENAELQRRLSAMEARLKALEDSARRANPSSRSSAVSVVTPALAMVGLFGLVVIGRNRKGGA